jgi:hypothetical protein
MTRRASYNHLPSDAFLVVLQKSVRYAMSVAVNAESGFVGVVQHLLSGLLRIPESQHPRFPFSI